MNRSSITYHSLVNSTTQYVLVARKWKFGVRWRDFPFAPDSLSVPGLKRIAPLPFSVPSVIFRLAISVRKLVKDGQAAPSSLPRTESITGANKSG